MKKQLHLERAVPPMPESFVNRMNDTLKEIETMKKHRKITVALIAAIVAVLALASVGVAQTVDSGILNRLFGSKQPSQEAASLLLTDVDSAELEGIALSVDELLFDGRSVNCEWSVSSAREQPVYVAVSGAIEGLTDEEFDEYFVTMGGSAFAWNCELTMLGGTEAVPAPASVMQEANWLFEELPEKDLSLRITVTAYESPLAPVLYENSSAEEFFYNEEARRAVSAAAQEAGQLPVTSGAWQLYLDQFPAWLDAAQANPDAPDKDILVASGLMQPVAVIELSIPLERVEVPSGEGVYGPAVLEMDDCTVEVLDVTFTPAAVTMNMNIYPKNHQEGQSFFDYRVFASANGEAWLMSLMGDERTDEEGRVYYSLRLDGPPVDAIPDELTFVRTTGAAPAGESPMAYYNRLIPESPEGMHAVMRLK